MDRKPNQFRNPRRFLVGGTIAALLVSLFGYRWYDASQQTAASPLPSIVVSAGSASSTTAKEDFLTHQSITAAVTDEAIAAAEHPFDPLLLLADMALANIDQTVQDYTATLNSQVFADGKLQAEKQLFCKIRHAADLPKGKVVPFSVYTKFLQPASNAGQEVIWVEGWHQGNLVAHLTGWANLMNFYLDPDSARAMEGNLHPIRDIGFRNLIVELKRVAVLDRKRDECSIRIDRNLSINDRPCTMFEATHPQRRDHFEYHIARIYIDNELNIPIAYEGFLWPEKPGDAPPLLEKYYYTDINLNVGLQDIDFDPANEEYNFPSR